MALVPAGHVPLIGRLLRRLRPAPLRLDPQLWRQACQRSLLLAGLQPDHAAQVAALTARFLHDKTISPIGDLTLDDADRTLLAALCCLPLRQLGTDGLQGWSELIVYPEAFGVKRSHVDAAGVMHQWDDQLIGEAWDNGPLILSWADVQADLYEPDAGFCVAVHEMAHKIDVLDGAMDGTPPLPREWQRQWATDFQREWEHFCRRVDAGQDTLIDPYAAEAEEEFFAVASEYHFSAPRLLAAELPAVAAHLQRYYGTSPMAVSTASATGPA